mmetsp:Transcript_26833/g.59079  ORF Transcript_26833/g.59079 Transcript_26833/m.59079 type:complete len:213 (-) Transcript_26833:77-715(-)
MVNLHISACRHNGRGVLQSLPIFGSNEFVQPLIVFKENEYGSLCRSYVMNLILNLTVVATLSLFNMYTLVEVSITASIHRWHKGLALDVVYILDDALFKHAQGGKGASDSEHLRVHVRHLGIAEPSTADVQAQNVFECILINDSTLLLLEVAKGGIVAMHECGVHRTMLYVTNASILDLICMFWSGVCRCGMQERFNLCINEALQLREVLCL